MRMLIKAALAITATLGAPAVARDLPYPGDAGADSAESASLSPDDVAHYRKLFAAIDGADWSSVTRLLDEGGDKALNAFARAEYFLAPTSPKIPLEDVMALVTAAPDLPQAPQLLRLAQKRGGTALPSLPSAQPLIYQGGAPKRDFNLKSVADPVAAQYAPQMLDSIKNDDPGSAEAVLNGIAGQLSPAALSEWQYRIAWSYYIESDDVNARRMAALAATGNGEAAAQAHWAAGLGAWRMGDYSAAAEQFQLLARRSGDDEMRAAGNYWTSRAQLAAGKPRLVAPALKAAARLGETFYGMLAGEALGAADAGPASLSRPDRAAWRAVQDHPNVRIAVALAGIGEIARADEALRYQAKIGGARDYTALLALARALNLPGTQLYLAHYAPAGQRPDRFARYPQPNWTPQGGWRVDRALLFAHALQESNFRTNAVSGAGATGLLQVRPGTARDMANARGAQFATSDLKRPDINMEYGQSYIENLRDSYATGGLLPKVIAAYNAGPNPVARWNGEVKAGNDPLLFIESIPYWETRGYVGIVLRNYWMYQRQASENARTLKEMAQGKWPAFPTIRTRTAQQGN